MSKKIILALSAALAIALCAAVLAACGGHPHALTAHAAQAAGCTEAGNSAYWSCEACGKYFADAEGKTEIDMSSVTFKGLPDGVQSKEYQDSIDWFGAAKIDEASEDTQVDVNLPSISSGLLNSDVYNRYIMPIGSTTISASNGKLHNSYGYND